MKCLYLHTTTCAHTHLEDFINSIFLIFVGASYMLGRALTSIIWGILADRIGRKPIIIITIFSMLVALFSWTSFELSNRFTSITYLQPLFTWLHIYGYLFESQPCIQHLVWTERALLDGDSYTVSSWFFNWFSWHNKSMVTKWDIKLILWFIQENDH